MAKARHAPTEKLRTEAAAFAAVGVPHHDMAILLGITTKTLLKYYRSELDMGKAKANAQIATTLFRKAKSGNITAAIYWTKTQMGWRETPQVLEHIGKDGGPIRTIGAVTSDEASRLYREIMGGGKV